MYIHQASKRYSCNFEMYFSNYSQSVSEVEVIPAEFPLMGKRTKVRNIRENLNLSLMYIVLFPTKTS